MFEGVISLFALNPEPVDTPNARTIAGASSITWKLLVDLSSSFDVVEQCEATIKEGTSTVARTTFPAIIPVALESRGGLQLERKPVMAGHVWTLAWYLSVFPRRNAAVRTMLNCFASYSAR